MPAIPTKFRKCVLAVILAGLHTALFLLIALLVAVSGNPEAGMAYSVFLYIDYPLSRLLRFGSGLSLALLGGGLLWFLYGFALQALFSVRSLKGLIPLGVSLLCIALLFALPGLSLIAMPKWETHWERGTEARETGNFDLAIEHVSQAAQLAPATQPILAGIWDYLGRLYMERKDYDEAEKAFSQALKVVTERADSRSVDFLNCHNQLAWFYRRTDNVHREKQHLEKAITYNRLVYEGDSTQEGHAWHRLAEIAFASGDHATARELQIKSINMEMNLPHASKWSISYRREQLAKWEIESAGPAKGKP